MKSLKKPVLLSLDPAIYEAAKHHIKESGNMVSEYLEYCLLILVANNSDIPNKKVLRQKLKELYIKYFYANSNVLDSSPSNENHVSDGVVVEKVAENKRKVTPNAQNSHARLLPHHKNSK